MSGLPYSSRMFLPLTPFEPPRAQIVQILVILLSIVPPPPPVQPPRSSAPLRALRQTCIDPGYAHPTEPGASHGTYHPVQPDILQLARLSSTVLPKNRPRR